MSQSNRNSQIAASKHPTKVHPGYNGTDSDLSGQLPKVLVGHSRHAGTSLEKSEHMIKSDRTGAALSQALPVTGSEQDSE